jgi:hypothetical protein
MLGGTQCNLLQPAPEKCRVTVTSHLKAPEQTSAHVDAALMGRTRGPSSIWFVSLEHCLVQSGADRKKGRGPRWSVRSLWAAHGELRKIIYV